LASIKLKRAKLALFASLHPVQSLLAFPDRTYRQRFSDHVRSHEHVRRVAIDVEKSYGQKAALAVGALR
jgi:hypothetical protein